jgi:RNA polymerase sigma factor (TIGR02999 family)
VLCFFLPTTESVTPGDRTRLDAPLTQLLAQAAQGERAALDQVFSLVYPELRAIASARLRVYGRVAHLDTTSLVHESYLRLVNLSKLSITDRKHFFTYAAKMMRNVAIDIAREHLAQRRGGDVTIVQLDTALGDQIFDDANPVLLRVHDALLALEAVDPLVAQVVEMRFFAGYSDSEVAELLETSERTVRRQWQKGRAFLLASLNE